MLQANLNGDTFLSSMTVRTYIIKISDHRTSRQKKNNLFKLMGIGNLVLFDS